MTRKRIKGGARLRDVAAAAGVSKSTASAVINGRAGQYGICPTTQDRVKAAARQLGYAPSLAALDMSAGRNSLVGLVFTSGYPGGDGLVVALEEACSRAGFRLMVSGLPAEPQDAMEHIAGLSQFGVAGVIICSPDALPLPKMGCPAVRIGRAGAGLPAVYEDIMDGGRQLARRLLDRGHRTIAVIGAAQHAPEEEAVRGFLDSCAQIGAAVRRFNSVQEFALAGDTVTAVFCASSSALLELYVNGAGVRRKPGQDFGVVAMDCLGVAQSIRPRPVVLRHGIDGLAQGAVQLLQQAMLGAVADIRLAPVIVEGNIIPAPAPAPAVVPPSVIPPPLVTPPPYRQPVVPPPPVTPSRPVVPPVLAVETPSEPVQIAETGGQTPPAEGWPTTDQDVGRGSVPGGTTTDQDVGRGSVPGGAAPEIEQPATPETTMNITEPVADPLNSVSPSESDVPRPSTPDPAPTPAVEIQAPAPITEPVPIPEQPIVVEEPAPAPAVDEVEPIAVTLDNV